MTLTVDAVTPESRAVGHEAQRRRSSVRGEKRNGSWGEEEKGFLGYSGISYRLPAAASKGKSSMAARGRRARCFVRQENLVCCLGDDDGRRRRDGWLPAGLGRLRGRLCLSSALRWVVRWRWRPLPLPLSALDDALEIAELSCMRLVWRNLQHLDNGMRDSNLNAKIDRQTTIMR